jgi:hypothetical protein
LKALDWKIRVYLFICHFGILRPFDVFKVIWYAFLSPFCGSVFGIYFPILVCYARNNLATPVPGADEKEYKKN